MVGFDKSLVNFGSNLLFSWSYSCKKAILDLLKSKTSLLWSWLVSARFFLDVFAL